jgi:hypothetical protein
MMICNDRRWAEAWRCYGLQGAEIIAVGYNTANWAPDLFGHPEGTFTNMPTEGAGLTRWRS